MECRFLPKRIPVCLRILKSARPNLRPHWPPREEPQRPPPVIYTFEREVVCEVRRVHGSDNNITDGAGLDPDRQQLLRQLKAGKKVLTRVCQEKNNLQDANTQLGEELKDVRAQLSNSVKENRRLRRGIYSKCLSELLKRRVRRGSRLTEICL